MKPLSERLYSALNDRYRDLYCAEFTKQFGVNVSVEYSIVSMRLCTVRDDGKHLTAKMCQWSKAFSDGYAAAMQETSNYMYQNRRKP